MKPASNDGPRPPKGALASTTDDGRAELSQPTTACRLRRALPLFAGAILLTALLIRPVAGEPASPVAVAFGGGEYAPPADYLAPAERAAIEAEIAATVTQLERMGKLAGPRAAERVALGWPLAPREGFTDPGYHAVTGFVDHAAGYPNQLLDYACGGRTYDSSSGYNHKGTDFYLWPFAWNKMAAGDVRVVAAADGVIVGVREGNPDQSCSFNSNPWNAVYVRHADGSIAWYGHLKRGSATTKPVGAAVARGETLGLVGSSGNSTGPHLHFELYSGGALTDPYAGTCNPLDGGSWWAGQPEYYDSAVNKLTTGPAPPQFATCPAPDNPNESTRFQPGDRIYFTAYYRDQLNSQPALYRIVAPGDALYAQWSHASPKAHYTLSYWYWAYDIPASAPTGTWRFEVTFNGRTTAHAFVIGQPSTPAPSATATTAPTPTATPLPTRAWQPSHFLYVPSVVRER